MSSPPLLTVQALSMLSRDAFVAALDGIFEHSPWVAERAWESRPFASHAALLAALAAAMHGAPATQQLALIRAHPQLAGRAAVRGELTAESTHEQQGAGLKDCSPEEYARLCELNLAYEARFGFPYILAVRGHTRQSIIANFATRLENAVEVEFGEALRQIERIAEMRLGDRVVAD